MKFVVCSSPRTGSHALATALNKHSQLKVAGEIFYRPRLFDINEKKLDKIIDTVFSKYNGFILHRKSDLDINFNFTIKELWNELLKTPDIKIINLKRHDLLEMTISLHLAMDFGNWQKFKIPDEVLSGYLSGDNPINKIYINPKDIEFYLNRYKNEYITFDAIAAKYKNCNIFYENLLSSWDNEINKIQRFLNLKNEKLTPSTIKQKGGRKFVENYKELQTYFRNTEWDKFFPDLISKHPIDKKEIQEDNKIINGLWIGSQLGKMEKLTIKSFLDYGHEFHLWTYNHINTPKGTIIRDANEIIPKEEVFSYVPGSLIENSVAGFSDIFRFALLYKIGGWYVDMDVTCLQSFDFNEEIVLRRNNWVGTPVANIIKLPKNTQFAYDVWQKTKKLVNQNNIDFILPMSILAVEIAEHGLQPYLLSPEIFVNSTTNAKKPIINNDIEDRVSAFNDANFRNSLIYTNKAYAIHWCNQFHHWNKINTSDVIEETIYSELIEKHEIEDSNG